MKNLLVPAILGLAIVSSIAAWVVFREPEKFGTGIAENILFADDLFGVANAVIKE